MSFGQKNLFLALGVAAAVSCAALVSPVGASGFLDYIDLETGLAINDYNDIRIPRDSGTEFSLTDDFDVDPAGFLRLRIGLFDSGRHELSAFAAPLRFSAKGAARSDIFFAGRSFPAGTALVAQYRFDSYRVTYLYELKVSEKWQVDIGFTAKIRDAEVSLASAGVEASYANTGFVPLFAFKVGWRAREDIRLLAEGDALAAPGGQGRAEDVFLGLEYDPKVPLALRFGYRFLEGGADVEEVYNFTLVHYVAVGMRLSL